MGHIIVTKFLPQCMESSTTVSSPGLKESKSRKRRSELHPKISRSGSGKIEGHRPYYRRIPGEIGEDKAKALTEHRSFIHKV